MRKPDSCGDQTEKRTVLPGEPANISQSPWKVLEVKEDKLADHTQYSRYGEGGEDGQDGEDVQ